jgi:hypothetical protein
VRTNPSHHDDVALSAAEKIAYGRLVAAATAPRPGPAHLRLARWARGRAERLLLWRLRPLDDAALSGLGWSAITLGGDAVLAGLVLGLVAAGVVGVALVGVGTWCLVAVAGRPGHSVERLTRAARTAVGRASEKPVP